MPQVTGGIGALMTDNAESSLFLAGKKSRRKFPLRFGRRLCEAAPAPFFTRQIWFTVKITVACFPLILQCGVGAIGFDNYRLIVQKIDQRLRRGETRQGQTNAKQGGTIK